MTQSQINIINNQKLYQGHPLISVVPTGKTKDTTVKEWYYALWGPIALKLATAKNETAGIVGVGMLCGLGLATSGYIGYQPPEGSALSYINEIAKAVGTFIGVPEPP